MPADRVRAFVWGSETRVHQFPLGTVWLLDQLWKLLGIDAALAGVLGERWFRTDVERVLFALVANRAIAPGSKLAAGEWVTRDVVVSGLPALDGNNQALRAMDLLIEGDAEGAVQKRCSSPPPTCSTSKST